MEVFWGDASGDRFYNGDSGFAESRTRTVIWGGDMKFKYSIEKLDIDLGLKVADILNQSRNLRRTVSAEYVEDVCNNILGRFFLFSVSFNFGKMNAKKNKNAEGAMWNMM